MRKYFNTEGVCIPEKHYMVPLDDRIHQIKEKYVERGSYFIINRGRQYGKTTILYSLARYLKQEYMVVFMDFQGIGTEEFRNEAKFSRAFAKMFSRAVKISGGEDFSNGAEVWTARGIGEAVSRILDERIPLFYSMIRHLED